MAYPTTLDSFTNPQPTDRRDSPSLANTITSVQDSSEALQAKVGIDGSADTDSHDYKLGDITGSDKAVGESSSSTLTNKTLTSPTIETPSITMANDESIYAKDAGGTPRNIAKVDNSDILVIGDDDLTEVTLKTKSKARAYLDTLQAIPTTTETLVELDAEAYDPGGNYDTSTYKFTAPITGYYMIYGQVSYTDPGVGTKLKALITVGTTNVVVGEGSAVGTTGDPTISTFTIRSITAGETISLETSQDSGGDVDLIASAGRTYLEVHLLSV